jgi:hypothetical protein
MGHYAGGSSLARRVLALRDFVPQFGKTCERAHARAN